MIIRLKEEQDLSIFVEKHHNNNAQKGTGCGAIIYCMLFNMQLWFVGIAGTVSFYWLPS